MTTETLLPLDSDCVPEVLNISRAKASEYPSMRTIRPLKKRVKSPPTSEWLRVVESFENLMEERVSEDAPRTKESLIDKDTLLVVTKAYDVTLRYYTAVLGGRKHDRRAERLISQLWQKAGTRMKRYDPALANKLKAKNSFWSKKVTWENETIQEVWPHLNAIRVCANRMDLKKEHFSTS
jgi:hypothetical protein